MSERKKLDDINGNQNSSGSIDSLKSNADSAPPLESKPLEEVVAASQARIADSQAKRGRGRPKKSQTGDGGDIHRIRQGATRAPTPTIDREQLSRVLGNVVEVPYTVLAETTGCEALSLSPQETKVQSDALSELVVLLAPTMEPKNVAILGICASIGGVALGKYRIYTAWQKEQNKSKLDSSQGL